MFKEIKVETNELNKLKKQQLNEIKSIQYMNMEFN